MLITIRKSKIKQMKCDRYKKALNEVDVGIKIGYAILERDYNMGNI